MRKSRQEYNEIRERERQNKEYYSRPDGKAACPHTICISVNNRCNMKCRMCDIGKANRERHDIGKEPDGYLAKRYVKENRYIEFPIERLEALVDEVADFQPTIKANFVEPLTYGSLCRFAQYVKRNGLKFYTITNGWLLERNAEWIVEEGVDLIRISMDGTEPVHDDIRGITGSFLKTVNGIERLLELKKKKNKSTPIIGICLTISNYNYLNLVDFMDELNRRKWLNDIYINFNHLLYTTGWEVEATRQESSLFDGIAMCSMDDIHFDQFDIHAFNGQIARLHQKYDPTQYHYYFSPALSPNDLEVYYNPASRMYPGTPCYLPWYAAQIEVNGDVGIYGHCILPSLGNIMAQGFHDVWNSPRALEIRRELRAAGSFTACNKCIGTLYPLRGRD
ncbi:MAG: radical SAM/SPASM domain-containing protein [Candidatus Omnitrophota bacterium]